MDNSTRQAKRAPVTLKIKFKSETLAQFIERYAVDVSPGGIFIRTKEPLAVGTPMKFEFQLRDATPLITGEGTVVWTRENDPARPNAAPGMGVRFDRLGDGSQTVLDKILAEKNKQGAAAAAEPQQRMFTDAPTRVAPSPLVGQLLGESRGKLGEMAPPRAGFGDERTDTTPLPRPMPFHSDAEEFPDETFEEATKVRTVEDLIAATAHGGSASLKTLTRTTLQTSMPPAPPSAPARTSPPIPPPPPTGALHPSPIPPPPPRPTPAMPMPAQAAPTEAEAPDADPPTTPIEPRAAAADAAQADAAPADAAQADAAADVVSAEDAGVELAAPMAEDAALATVPAADAAAAQPDAESELAPPPSPRPTPPMPIKAAEPPADDAAATPEQDAASASTGTPGTASTEPAADAAADASAEPAAATDPETAPIVAAETTGPREPTPMPRPAATATPAPFEAEETQRVKPIAVAATPAAAATPAPQGARKRPTGVPVPPPELTDPNRKHGVTAAAQLEPPPGVGTGMVVMAVVFVAALVGLVWFFFLRGDKTPETPAVPDLDTEVTTAPTGAGTGSAATPDEPLPVDDTDSAQPTGKTVPTQIRATVVDAMVSIPGTNLSGPAPFVANLVKDEPYTARVSAPGYRTKSIALTGGQKLAPVKLEPMPRIIHVSSNPPGATVLIDGDSTGRKTPTDIALSPRQAAKASIKIGLSKANFTSFVREIVVADFVVDGEEMVMAIDAELVAKARGDGGGERAGDGGGAGAAGGGGAGADDPPPAPAPIPAPPNAVPAAASTDTLK